ncbi:hypothetical protein C8A03DRAFT_33623 [Achaetomium macrosporum]|uniref:Uncharacterized protein n=1 Tax=Achaetomium macrosporum TaxID=79813 RepID=A0AAN7CAK0_9PEZI|nr:hypothetical protein C8A03DRAFT_33623 [Achaetomium macrosporum]
MAAPLIGMSKDRFRDIRQNAITELEDGGSDADYSTATMALMVACLNHHYRDYSVYFALLNAPGLDLRAYPPYPRNSIFVFHQHGGLWSTAWIDRTKNKIVAFDGVSSTPNVINDDPRSSIAATAHLPPGATPTSSFPLHCEGLPTRPKPHVLFVKRAKRLAGRPAARRRLTGRFCFFTGTYQKPREEPRLIVHEPCNAALSQTNTEAHDNAPTSAGPTLTYDPQRHILYITEDSFDDCMGKECGYNGREWATETHHLALPFSLLVSGSYPRNATAWLSSLETLSIVYPSSPGTFSFNAARSSRMTEEELKGLTIEADYMYGTWMRDFPVRWTKSGLEHMESAEAGTDRECRLETAGDQLSPLWDHAAQRLGIRWEARCFQA